MVTMGVVEEPVLASCGSADGSAGLSAAGSVVLAALVVVGVDRVAGVDAGGSVAASVVGTASVDAASVVG